MEETFQSLHEMLQTLYTEMLPLSDSLIGPARAIGGMGAFLFIAAQIFDRLAKAEAIDVTPMIRPLVLGLVIGGYPTFLGFIEGLMKPTISATESMVSGQHDAIIALNKRKEEVLKQKAENEIFEDKSKFNEKLASLGMTDIGGKVGLYVDKATYEAKKSFRLWIKNLLELCYHTASLAVNTVRTFFLIVLSIIGPIALGVSVFPGFEGSLTNWVGQYINVYLWLPVANVFGAICGKIQVLMLESDLQNIQSGSEGGLIAADYGYLIFLLIAIIGYIMVPTVAGWAVSASGLSSALGKISSVGTMAATAAAGAATGGASTVAGAAATGTGMARNIAQNLRTPKS